MKIKLLITLIFTSLILVGCNNQTIVDNSTEMEPEQITEGEFLEKNKENVEEATDIKYLGTWTRTAIYVNGVPEDGDPATITFLEDGTYHSESDTCATSGEIEVTGKNEIMMTMTQNSCPGDLPLPFVFTYTYKVELDENNAEAMTTITGPVMETYIR